MEFAELSDGLTDILNCCGVLERFDGTAGGGGGPVGFGVCGEFGLDDEAGGGGWPAALS